MERNCRPSITIVPERFSRSYIGTQYITQVIVLHDKLTSYVQVRGSVPLFWEQTGLQGVGSHRIQLTRGYEFTHPAFDKHVKWLIDNYGHTLLINLLGNKEAEQVLSDAYQKHLKHSIYCNDVSMVTFDYNSHCRGNDKSHLESHLLPQTAHYIESFDFFATQGDHMIRKQVGVIRTNCMDCMDRSNVVQAFYGLKMLQKQLLEYDLGSSTSIISQFEDVFQSMWSRHGNNISLLVTGSAALSKKDKFKDGALSIQRSIQNNFFDSSKQEAIELLLWSNVFNDELGYVTRALLPSSDVFSSRAYKQDLIEHYMEYTDSVPIRVCAGTWNVNGGKYTQSIAYKNQSMSCWLLDTPMAAIPNLRDCPPDIYAIGFEELVDLNASNIVSTSSSNRKYWGKELQKIFSAAEDYNYCLLTSHQLVGLCLYVFVRPHLAPYIRDVAVSTVKTGMSGKVGNKGAVGVRMLLYSTGLAFVCAHLTAHQSHVNERNSDFNEIWKKMSFPNNVTLSSHDYVFWCGDLNYRIDLTIDKVKEAIAAQNWPLLQKHDQLLKSKYAGKAFQGFVEGELNFAPTYKYDSFSDDYDTSEKGRIPAWTDRIMWWYHSLYKALQPSNSISVSQGAHPTDVLLMGKDHMSSCAGSCDLNPGKLMFYGRAELKTSDHRPVIAVIDIEAIKVNNHKRQLVARDVILSLGPPDCTIMILGNVELDDIQSELLQYGEIVFVRLLEEKLLVTYKESKSALAAVALNGLEVNGVLLSVQLFTKWPPPDDDVTMTSSKDDESSKTESLQLPSTSMPMGSSHSSPRGSPYFSPKRIESPLESPIGSSHSSPWQSVHSSPYHSTENSPHPSPQLSPKLGRKKHTTVQETTRELYEENIETSFEDEAMKPTVTGQTSSTSSPPCVSQFQQLLDKVPTTSPTPQGSTRGIGLPYNVHHHTHGLEQNGKVIVSKPARPPPMKQPQQAKSLAGEKLPPPKRPPPPKQQQLATTTGNKPPRPPLPTKSD